MMAEDLTACDLIPDCSLCPERHECIYAEIKEAVESERTET